MGAPTCGELYVEPWQAKAAWEACNPAIMWSDDSMYLAVPQWAEDRSQRLLLVVPEQSRSIARAAGTGYWTFGRFRGAFFEASTLPLGSPARSRSM